MGFTIEDKLVIGVTSSALFDLAESRSVYETQGVEQYRLHQEQNLDVPFPKGVAFPFVHRFLSINGAFPDEKPVEVVLLSRNSPETGLRVFRSRGDTTSSAIRSIAMASAVRLRVSIQRAERALRDPDRGGFRELRRVSATSVVRRRHAGDDEALRCDVGAGGGGVAETRLSFRTWFVWIGGYRDIERFS